jgi:Flp pilus assembly pilin Flp
MNTLVRDMRFDEEGQDLVEYSLLIAFIAVTCMAVLLTAGQVVPGVWVSANIALFNANAYAAS